MPKKTINASDFKFRADLENYVRNTKGLTPEEKPDLEISGTREELARLQLSDRSVFWGIKCVITDTPTEKKTESKVDRGKQFASGINGNLKNNNK